MFKKTLNFALSSVLVLASAFPYSTFAQTATSLTTAQQIQQKYYSVVNTAVKKGAKFYADAGKTKPLSAEQLSLYGSSGFYIVTPVDPEYHFSYGIHGISTIDAKGQITTAFEILDSSLKKVYATKLVSIDQTNAVQSKASYEATIRSLMDDAAVAMGVQRADKSFFSKALVSLFNSVLPSAEAEMCGWPSFFCGIFAITAIITLFVAFRNDSRGLLAVTAVLAVLAVAVYAIYNEKSCGAKPIQIKP